MLNRMAMGLVALALIVPLAGCSSGTATVDSVDVTPPSVDAKSMLMSVAETGELGSASMEIQDALQQQADAGDAKAKAVLDQFSELAKLDGNPTAAKAKAKELADKL